MIFRPPSMRGRVCLGLRGYLLMGLILSLLVVAISAAQVTTITSDGTLGTAVTQNGNIHDITGGTRPGTGQNLFHSFGELSVGEGDIANFQNDTGLPTTNILGRVTGGNISNIFGTIQTEGFGNANLFLTNPAGWVFGPNAALNVAGSVNFTTADYLKHSDGVQFTALPSEQDSQLSVAAISAFGFLAANPNGIVVDGSTLSVSEGHSISLVSGDITIGSGLNAPGGEIHLASVASPGEILAESLDQAPNVNGESFAALGTIQVSQKSVIDASGDGGGTVRIRGGRFVMVDSTISANTTGPSDDASPNSSRTAIDIMVTGDLVLNDRSTLEANVLGGARDGGNIILNVGEKLEIRGGSPDLSQGPFAVFDGVQTLAIGGSGQAGDIDASANSVLIVGDILGIQSSTFSSATSGDISVTANTLQIDGRVDGAPRVFAGGIISSLTVGEGQGGNVDINVPGGEIALDNGQITATTFGTGNGGNLTVKAHDVHMINEAIMQTGTNGPGNAGSTEIQLTGDLEIRSGSFIGSLVGVACVGIECGAAGDTIITAKDIKITGVEGAEDPLVSPNFTGIRTRSVAEVGGNVIINGDNLHITDNGVIRSSSIGPERAGDITINLTGSLEVNEGGQVLASARGSGDAANITVLANSVDLRNEGSSITAESTSAGNAGSVILNVNDLTTDGGAEISSRSASEASDSGGGGSIEINAIDSIDLKETKVLTSVAGGSKPGGDITITAGQNFQLTNNSTISAESSGAGDSGAVTLIATGGNFQSVDSTVSTSAQQGEGGSIEIIAGQNMQLTNDSTVSAESSGAGDSGAVTLIATGGNFQSVDSTVSTSAQQAEGGDIAITAGQNVQLVNNTTLSAESFGLGDAGDITVTSGNNIQMVNSLITTQAAQASGGNIKLTAPNIIQLVNSQIISSVFGGPMTSGGNINLDPLFIILQNSQILANAFQGQGGNINLTATNGIFIDFSSIVDASSALGISGTVRFNGAVVALAESVTQLPQNIVKIASLFAERCAAQKGGQFSSFVQGGSDGLPPAPGGFLTSPLMFTNPGAQSSSALPSSGKAALVSSLPQLRLGLDHVIGSPDGHSESGFRAMNLLPELGCAA